MGTTPYCAPEIVRAGEVVDVFYTQDGFAAIRYGKVIAFVDLNDLSQG